MRINLLVIVPDDSKRSWLIEALCEAPELAVVGAGPDLHQAFMSGAQAPFATLVVVDLACPEASDARFWTPLHVMYPAAHIMAMVERPLNEAALQAALHAGTYCFALWTDSPERLHEAARSASEGRRFYSAPWLIVAAQKLIKALETGMIQTSVVWRKSGKGRRARAYELTALESSVLAYFARSQGKVISPAELIREVWKQDPYTGDIANQVNCCIKRLRRKLTVDPGNRYEIQTVRGRGYRLVVGNTA